MSRVKAERIAISLAATVMVGAEGVGPPLIGPEPIVLPLNDTPVIGG